MSLTLRIAARYLFSKKSHHAINIISAVSALTVAVAAMAMLCTLSVFNGFRELVASFYSQFDPQLKLVPQTGKTFDISSTAIQRILTDPDLADYSFTLEEQALCVVGSHQCIVTLKGVDDHFARLTDIERILYGNPRFLLSAAGTHYATPGISLAGKLQIGATPDVLLRLYAPQQGERVSINADEAFSCEEMQTSGSVFVMQQAKYDDNYLLVPLSLAQTLFDKPRRASALEMRLLPDADEPTVRRRLQALAGSNFLLLNRAEQQADTYRIMQVERLVSLLFLAFITAVASCGIAGSVSMLVIDKKNDIRTLTNLGMQRGGIVRVFYVEALMIAVIGALVGIIAALALCLLQQQFGFITLGGSEGSFVVDAYPVRVRAADILAVLLLTVALSALTLYLPVRRLVHGVS